MLQIISIPSSGKTNELINYAEANDCTIVCDVPQHIMNKGYNMGIVGLDVRGYDWARTVIKSDYKFPKPIVIDELSKFANYLFDNSLEAFTLTKE